MSFRLHEVRIVETDVIFVLRIDNDSPVPLTITGGVHKIYIDGMRIGKANSDQQLQLPPFTSTTQEVLAHVSNLRFATRLQQIIKRGSYDYRLNSTLYFAGVSRLHRTNVTSDGHVNFNTFRPAAPHGVATPIKARRP